MKKLLIVAVALLSTSVFANYSMQDIEPGTEITLKQRIMFFSMNSYINVGVKDGIACYLQLEKPNYVPLVMRAGRSFTVSNDVSEDLNRIFFDDKQLEAVFCTGERELTIDEFKEVTKYYLKF